MTELSDAQFLGGSSAPAGGEMSDADFLGAAPTAKTAASKPAEAAPAETEEPSTAADVAKGVGQGAINAAEGLVGMPGDIVAGANWLGKKIDYPFNYGTAWLNGVARQKLGLLEPGETPHTYAQKMVEQSNAVHDTAAAMVPSSSTFQKEGQAVGVPNYQPQTTLGQYAKTLTEFGVGAAAMPGDTVGNVIKYGLVPGALSETAGQATQGTSAEPYARAIAGLTGGIGADLATGAGRAAAGAARNWWEPATEGGYEPIAVRNLRAASSDPELMQATLQEGADAAKQNGTAIGENVQGSKPTLPQYLGDDRLLQVERDMAVNDTPGARNNEHGTGSDQQNAARVQALQGLQPTGAPEEVGNLVRQQMADLQAAQDAKVAEATDAAGQSSNVAVTSAEGAAKDVADTYAAKAAAAEKARETEAEAAAQARESAMSTAQKAREDELAAATQAREKEVGQAQDTAQSLADKIGSGATKEEQGAAMRGVLQASRKVATTNEGTLHEAIDPNRTLNLVAAPIAAKAKAIVGDMPELAGKLSGEEADIFDAASNLSDVMPFREVAALQSRVSTAMREVLGKDPQAFRRLSQLRGAIGDTIQNAVENQAGYEAGAVRAGTLAPEQTMAARVQQWADEFKAQKAASGETVAAPKAPLEPNFDEAAAARETAARAATVKRVATHDKGPVGVVNRKEGNSETFKQPDSAVPSKVFVKGDRGGQAVKAVLNAAGPRGMNQLANIAAEDLRAFAVGKDGVVDPKKFETWSGRYREALNAMPAELRQKFSDAAAATETLRAVDKQHAAAIEALEKQHNEAIKALGKDQTGEVREMTKRHADEVRALKQEHAQIIDPLQSAVESLSSKAMKDGVIDPKEFARWQSKHADEIAQLPPDVRDSLSTAAKASEAVGVAAAKRKEAIDGYQKSVAGKFLGVEHPDDVTRVVGGLLDSKNSVAQMTALAKRLADNPDAVQGLRKAVADIITKRAMSTVESGASGTNKINAATLQKMIRDKRATIKAAGYSDKEIGLMQAVADDLQRSQRTMESSRLAGTSGSSQDLVKFMKDAKKAKEAPHAGSLLTRMIIGGYAGFEHGGLYGMLGGAGAGVAEHALEKMVQARRNAGLAKASDLFSDMIQKPELALAMLKKYPAVAGRGSEYTLQKLLQRNSMFATNTLGREQGENRQ